MLVFTSEIEVNGKTPEQIYNWFINLNSTDEYKKWHPEHVEWKTKKRTSNGIGSVIYFDEWIGKFRMKLTGELVETEPNRLFVFKLKGLPAYLSLALEPTKNGTKVIHVVRFGYKGALGAVLDFLLKLLPIYKSFKRELDRHAHEEFKNLERLLGA